MTMLLAWAAFWLSTAFFPCCAAIAVAFGDHSDSVLQSVPHALLVHDADETHPDRPDHSPDPPCGHIVSAGPATVDVVAVLATEHSSPEWFALDAHVPSDPVAANNSWNRAPREIPPPRVRLYLRELRLLL